MSRGFEVVSEFKDKNIVLPRRQTQFSAGYDIAAAKNIIIQAEKLALIPTGIKAYMEIDEYLGIHIRSSMAVKQQVMLANSQGIIDSDYYNNPGNEGHIFIAVYNFSCKDVEIIKGERIAQGIFYKYLISDNDLPVTIKRENGCGSTGC